MSPQNHVVSLAESQQNVVDSTNPGGALDDGVEDRLHVRGRAADNAKHLGGRRLMFQSFPQFCIALLDLLEQSDILDGDDGLISEGLEERDLLVGKWMDLCPADRYGADGNTL